MSELHEQFCQTISVLDLGPLMRRFAWCENGRPAHKRTWMFHAFLAKSIYQFPAGEPLVTSGDGQVRLLRENGEVVRSFEGAADFMNAGAVTPDGSTTVAGGQDGVLHLWNGGSKDKLASFAPAR